MSKFVFCFIYYNCIIILLSVTVFVCHDKGNLFCTINSPVYVYWKQIITITYPSEYGEQGEIAPSFLEIPKKS